MAFPSSGSFVVPGALVPVETDRERDVGTYVESSVWVVHEVEQARELGFKQAPADRLSSMSEISITAATADDLPRLAEIERSAASIFPREDVPAAMAGESMPLEELERAKATGRLWVARLDGEPVGFLVGGTKDGLPYVAELDVHPDLQRRGIGTALLRTAIGWARLQGAAWLTLTTFRHLPFNAPFYAKLGFAEIPAAELGTELRAQLEDEARRGLDSAKRVAMRLGIDPVGRTT